ncbi:class I SAM-dependent methyltransferase [Cryptosporangium phraense]|uniref:class I SAM-dependent methyltransferase n=1 Tax=Cryptosporangium phraense TaxID=2593070 RepID=UPI0014794F07|nr:class I SAM-dependent methyltransferase [Cryptosporangium phraense]
MDGYAAAAQYYDLLHAERTAARARALLGAAGGEIRHGILDLGAGTGSVIAALAAEVPEVPIVAVEPSVGMRTALYARLAADPSLRGRTTVVPDAAERFAVSEGFADLAVCLDTSPAFPPPYRPDIWQRVRDALVPGGVFLLDEPALTEPVVQQPRELGRVAVGTHTVVGSVRGEPAGQRQWWEYRYTVLDAEGEVLSEEETEFYTWPMSSEDLRAELAEAGFVLKDDIELDGLTVLQAVTGP